jgi:threonine dehydrogenase-like Zn-dependent dehydrogenase
MSERRVAFTALEYHADGRVAPAPYVARGSEDAGWRVDRGGAPPLVLGPGYVLLRTSHCGICATDLARRDLPFPLPQALGHEVVAVDDAGRAVVVEINASHVARGVPHACAHCASGLATHCPERLVLGIHDLPGGFAPWILAPRHAIVPLPSGVDARTATFAEPFAAAFHAVRVVTRTPRRRIAVLGPRRLGMLVVAALAAWRRRTGAAWEIVALARRPALRELARALGADDAADPERTGGPLADVVVETTGSPDGLARALELATDEVHVKTTCGAPAAGLRHATEMVVDEAALLSAVAPLAAPLAGPALATAVVLPSASRAGRDAVAALGVHDVARLGALPFGAADVAVAGTLADVDAAIRPEPGRERGLVRPRGVVVVAPDRAPTDPLTAAIATRGLAVTTSRCGDLRAALELLATADPAIAERLVTSVRPADALAAALDAAATPGELKVVVAHPGALV